ncbi:MAG: hypothetical protein ABIJ48_11925 [Actinomycetota bacterium]
MNERADRTILPPGEYARLYCHDIGDGVALAAHCANYRGISTTIRPHEDIGLRRPADLYRQTPTTQPPTHEPVSET